MTDGLEPETFTFTFTREQHTTLIAALTIAGVQYADPVPVIETLRVVSPLAARVLEVAIASRLVEGETDTYG